jgi:hypothetical protein
MNNCKELEAKILSFRQELKKYVHVSVLELYDNYFNIEIIRKGNEKNTTQKRTEAT